MAFTRKKKTVIIALVVVGLITIIALSKVFQKKEGEPVQVGKVERRTQLVSKVTATGEIRPVQLYNLTAEVPGRVDAIYVAEGEVVKKGQPLVKVDPTQSGFAVSAGEASVRVAQADVQNQQVALDQARNNINQEKANLAVAEADLERLKSDFRYAESEYKRNEDLVEKGVINKSQFDSARTRFEQAQASVNAQVSRINQIKVQIKDAELAVARADASLNSSQQRVQQGQASLAQQADQLKKTTRYSPIDGVISSLPVKVGEYALASFSTTPLLTVADMSQINTEVYVDETDVADVQLGQKVKVKVDALGDAEIEGEVIEKGASAITKSGQTIASTSNSQEAKDFLVKIKLTPNEQVRTKLRPGMSATATITTAAADSVLTVPLQAIVPRELPKDKAAEQPQGQQPQQSSAPAKKKEVEGVFVFDNGKAKFVEVTTGIKGDQEIELKSGPKESDEIITGPYKTLRSLKDGDQVKREGKPTGAETKS